MTQSRIPAQNTSITTRLSNTNRSDDKHTPPLPSTQKEKSLVKSLILEGLLDNNDTANILKKMLGAPDQFKLRTINKKFKNTFFKPDKMLITPIEKADLSQKLPLLQKELNSLIESCKRDLKTECHLNAHEIEATTTKEHVRQLPLCTTKGILTAVIAPACCSAVASTLCLPILGICSSPCTNGCTATLVCGEGCWYGIAANTGLTTISGFVMMALGSRNIYHSKLFTLQRFEENAAKINDLTNFISEISHLLQPKPEASRVPVTPTMSRRS